MNAQEWLDCTDLHSMIALAESRSAPRKLILFGAACCRRGWHVMTDPRLRRVVEAAECLADGQTTQAEFDEVMRPVVESYSREIAEGTTRLMHSAARELGTAGGAFFASDFAARGLASVSNRPDDPAWAVARDTEYALQRDLLRDIVGDLSTPFSFEPAWLSTEGRHPANLARKMTNEGQYDNFPALAEALERAGCCNRAVLDHCRKPGLHVRGCWVVDALLGREGTVRVGLVTQDDWQRVNDPLPLLCFLRDKGSDRQWRLYAVACCRRIETLITDERSHRAVEVAERFADGHAEETEVTAVRCPAQQAAEEQWREEYVAEAEANFCMTPVYAAVLCRCSAASAALVSLMEIAPRPVVSAEDDLLQDFPGRATINAVNYSLRSGVAGPRMDDAEVEARAAEERAQAILLRDVFGAYLGPPSCESCWLPWEHRGVSNNPQQWSLLPLPRNLVVRPEWLVYAEGIVAKLALAIYEDKAFDRLPILADALLDAGCDEEDLLAHLREPGPHVRGCWALDLILGKN